MEELYKRIKSRRISLGLTQDELAELTGYSNRSAIARIENGTIDLPQSKIVAFAEALHTSIGYLMGVNDNGDFIDKDHDLYTSEEKDLIAKYRTATTDAKMTVHHVFKMDEEIRTLKDELKKK